MTGRYWLEVEFGLQPGEFPRQANFILKSACSHSAEAFKVANRIHLDESNT